MAAAPAAAAAGLQRGQWPCRASHLEEVAAPREWMPQECASLCVGIRGFAVGRHSPSGVTPEKMYDPKKKKTPTLQSKQYIGIVGTS